MKSSNIDDNENKFPIEKTIENSNINVKKNKNVSKTEKKQNNKNPGKCNNKIKRILFI